MAQPPVVIVGGGVAGLATGICLALAGVEAALYEKGHFPVDKPCGEGLMPTGRAILERLGVRQLLDRKCYAELTGIQFISQRGRVARAAFREGPGWGMRRTVLSAALLARARQLPGLTICPGVQVEGTGRDEQGIFVVVGGKTLRPRLLVGADGLHSPIRHQFGLNQTGRARSRYGLRQHFAIAPWNDYVEVHLANGAEAYITPCGPDVTQVAFLWDQDAAPGRKPGRTPILQWLDRFPEVRERLGSAPALDQVRGAGPFEQRVHSAVSDGLTLVGDASGYLDAITGEGLSLALTQSQALADCVARELRGGSGGMLTQAHLAPYERRSRQIKQAYWRNTQLVLALQHRPALAEATVRLLAAWPRLFQQLLSINMGTGGLGARAES